MPTVDEFRSAIRLQFREAESRGAPYIEINSGRLHRQLGGYPGGEQRMSSCCQAMYHEENAGDEIISRPAKGKGASLTIRYRLPRSATPISQGPRLVRPRADVVVPQIPLAPEVVDRGHRRLKVAGYDFQLICGVEPLKNPGGTVRQFMPQSRYRNLDNLSLNKYGKGPSFLQNKILACAFGTGYVVRVVMVSSIECHNISDGIA